MKFVIFGLIMFSMAVLTHAKEAQSLYGNDALENKMRNISKDLRCLKCQNQSIADSQSGFANQVRALLREQIIEGKTETEIKAFLTARYGDFIVYEPPFNLTNSLIWIFPIVLLVFGLSWLIIIIYRQQPKQNEDTALNKTQSARVEQLLKESEQIKGETS